jgi:hypothetical protein
MRNRLGRAESGVLRRVWYMIDRQDVVVPTEYMKLEKTISLECRDSCSGHVWIDTDVLSTS